MKENMALKLNWFGMPASNDNGNAQRRSWRGQILLTFAVFGFIAAVAYADSRVDEISLGYLYILPVALSALVNRRRTTLAIIIICVLLHDLFGPPHPLIPRLFLNFFALAAFSAVALVVKHLGKEREALSEIIRRQRDELDAEINLASQVQQQLLPLRPPRLEGLEIAAGIKYAQKMGGDYYDFIELPGGDIGIAIADVSGKGMAAALLMPPVEVALRLNANNDSKLSETFESLNRVINDVTDAARFVTLFYGKIRFPEHEFEYINAGHNPPLRFNRRTKTLEWLEAAGTPLGLLPAAHYPASLLRLEAEDIFVFYTDGLTESENPQGEQFSRERIAEIVGRKAGESAQEIYDELQNVLFEFRGSSNYDDDLTLIVMKVSF